MSNGVGRWSIELIQQLEYPNGSVIRRGEWLIDGIDGLAGYVGCRQFSDLGPDSIDCSTQQ
jgi:hypothetical protein